MSMLSLFTRVTTTWTLYHCSLKEFTTWTMIKGILIVNNHGKPRLVKFYQSVVRYTWPRRSTLLSCRKILYKFFFLYRFHISDRPVRTSSKASSEKYFSMLPSDQTLFVIILRVRFPNGVIRRKSFTGIMLHYTLFSPWTNKNQILVS